MKIFKIILKDVTVLWPTLVVILALSADAITEGKISIFRIISVLTALGLFIARAIQLVKFHAEKQVPFLVIAGKSDEQYKDMVGQVKVSFKEQGLRPRKLEAEFNVSEGDWISRRESNLPADRDAWLNAISRIEKAFWRLAATIPGKKVYHFFINAPAALAMGIGALLGSRNRYVLYHYQGSGGKLYHPVLRVETTRELKTQINHYKSINVEGIEEVKGEVFVSLYLAGHDPRGAVARLAEGKRASMVSVTGKFEGAIPIENDWLNIAKEISSLMLDLSARKEVKRLHVFLSLPVVISFAVGSALGKFVPASVYNWFPSENSYCEVLRLEEL